MVVDNYFFRDMQKKGIIPPNVKPEEIEQEVFSFLFEQNYNRPSVCFGDAHKDALPDPWRGFKLPKIIGGRKA